MVSKTNEQALEAAIERALTGTCIEDNSGNLADATTTSYSNAHLGYVAGFSSDFNKQYAIDERYFWQFLERTQQPELDKLKKHNPVDWQRKLLERYDRLIKKYGILHLLKKGLSVDDAHFNLMYPAPLVSSSEAVAKNFESNIFSCTRQLCYSQANPLQEIDMAPSVTLVVRLINFNRTDKSECNNGLLQHRF